MLEALTALIVSSTIFFTSSAESCCGMYFSTTFISALVLSTRSWRPACSNSSSDSFRCLYSRAITAISSSEVKSCPCSICSFWTAAFNIRTVASVSLSRFFIAETISAVRSFNKLIILLAPLAKIKDEKTPTRHGEVGVKN